MADNTRVSSSTCKNITKGACQTEAPLRILLAGSVWVAKEAFQYIPTVNLMDNNDPPGARPPKTSTPIKAAPEVDRSHSGKKLNISKIKGAHLLFETQDRWEKTQEKESKGKDQVETSQQVAGGKLGSAGDLPPGLLARLPSLPEREVTSIKPSNPAPEASSQGKKHPLDTDDEIVELGHDEVTRPPKKKKKKKNKSKDRSKDETPVLEAQDDGAHRNSPVAEPEVTAEEPALVPATPETPEEGSKVPKKKKKKRSAVLEKFRLEQREAKAKEMAWVKHRKVQHDQDFKALWNHWKTLPAYLLDTINGADHSAFLLGRLEKEGNYMNKKSGKKRNLMSVERLLSRIATYADEPEKRLKEAHQMTKATFQMVQGMPSGNKCTPALVVRVLMDCEGNAIACDHPE